MPFQVKIVVAIGRVSAGDAAARPVIEKVAGKTGGRVGGGVGSSQDPIIVEYGDKMSAVSAATELWYRDEIESARVDDTDNLNTAAVTETKVEETVDLIELVRKGGAAKDAVAKMLEAHKAAELKKAAEAKKAVEAPVAKVDEKKPEDKPAEPVVESVDPAEAPKITEMVAAFLAVAKLAEGLKSITATTLAEDAKSAAVTLTALLATQAAPAAAPVAAAAAAK